MKKICYLLFLLSLVACTHDEPAINYTDYVNPFVGTVKEGHCTPSATVPLGMVQVGPESTTEMYEGYYDDHVTGYQYTDSFLTGFTQTHLNGVGCPSMSDILLMPSSRMEEDMHDFESYKSRYDKASESAKPGFYHVYLTDNKVDVSLTASAHGGYHRYRFDDPEKAHLLVDLQYGVGYQYGDFSFNVKDAWDEVTDSTINGYRKPSQWADRDQYYTIQFDKKIASIVKVKMADSEQCKASRYLVTFDLDNDSTLEVRVGLSSTSVESAKVNLASEISPSDSFESVFHRASEKWNEVLSIVDIESTEVQKRCFYTALYHLYFQPNDIADVDGRFRSAAGEVRQSRSGKFYSTLSLWDTYRAAHPLYTILTPSLVPDMMSSIMEHYDAIPDSLTDQKFLPRWTLWGYETNTMIGNHAVPVLVDAWLKGLGPKDFSDQELFEAISNSLNKPHYRNHVALVNKYGYIPYDVSLSPFDDGRETVARLLEGAYDDYCASIFASDIGEVDAASFWKNRSMNYRNVYDPESGFMRGRNGAGDFKKDVDIYQVVGEWLPHSDFTEANAWHYLFHVQQDIPRLMKLMGGEKAFETKLDSMFSSPHEFSVKEFLWNIYGAMGQYWHGNEPCHHVPYLYKYTADGYKTDAILHKLVKDFNKDTPDGLVGNDDCGQMSSWYVFAVAGFYPVNPCGGEFVLGAPQVPSLTIHLEDGKTFEVKALNLSDTNKYVQAVSLNGRPLNRKYITYDEIMRGGTLEFVMGAAFD